MNSGWKDVLKVDYRVSHKTKLYIFFKWLPNKKYMIPGKKGLGAWIAYASTFM